MRWNTKQRTDPEGWQPWFAWHPVKLTTTNVWVWWESIERRGTVIYDSEDRGVWLWWYR